MKILTLSLIACFFSSLPSKSQTWSSVGTGLDGAGQSLAVHQGDLYVGGSSFTMAGGVPADNLAKWNGSSWSAVGTNASPGGTIWSMASYNGELYVGGEFYMAVANAYYIAHFNGSSWSGVGPGYWNGGVDHGPNAGVKIMAVNPFDNKLYLGGDFDLCGGVGGYTLGIASWNGTLWNHVGQQFGSYYGVQNWVSYSGIAVYNNDIYASDPPMFNAGGIAVNGLARLNVTTDQFSDPNSAQITGGMGVDHVFSANGVLYASTGASQPTSYFYRWNGSAWTNMAPVSGGLNSEVMAVAYYNGDLFVGGSFTSIGGVAANNIAKWSSSSGWSAVGSGAENYVTALTVYNGDLYVTGGFTSAGGLVNTVGIAKYHTTATPIGLISFTASPNPDKSVTLNWATSQETDNDHFEIERSADGNDFTTAGILTGEGTVRDGKEYQFVDEKSLSGTSYYRLKQVDKTGNFTFSSIAEVYLSIPEGISIEEIFPNPVVNSYLLTVNSSEESAAHFEMTDILGKTVRNVDYILKRGNNEISIDASSLAAGSYILKIVSGNETMVRKFIKE